MNKKKTLFFLLGLIIFAGLGFAEFNPINFDFLLGDLDLNALIAAQTVFDLYPVYLKVTNPSLSGYGNKIPNTCFSNGGCDLNTAHFLVKPQGHSKQQPIQYLVSNVLNGKVSFLSSFAAVLYLDKDIIGSMSAARVFLGVGGKTEIKEKTITTNKYKKTILLDGWYFYDIDTVKGSLSSFFTDYSFDCGGVGDDGMPVCMNNEKETPGFLFSRHNIKYCGEFGENTFIFVTITGFCPDVPNSTFMSHWGKDFICKANCDPTEEDTWGVSCDCMAYTETKVINVLETPNSFKSEFEYPTVYFEPITTKLCYDDYVTGVELKTSNTEKMQKIITAFDELEMPYKLKMNSGTQSESEWNIKFENGEAKIAYPGAAYFNYPYEFYFPYDKIEYSFGDSMGTVADLSLGKQIVELDNPTFTINCIYNYPDLEIQLK